MRGQRNKKHTDLSQNSNEERVILHYSPSYHVPGAQERSL